MDAIRGSRLSERGDGVVVVTELRSREAAVLRVAEGMRESWEGSRVLVGRTRVPRITPVPVAIIVAPEWAKYIGKVDGGRQVDGRVVSVRLDLPCTSVDVVGAYCHTAPSSERCERARRKAADVVARVCDVFRTARAARRECVVAGDTNDSVPGSGDRSTTRAARPEGTSLITALAECGASDLALLLHPEERGTPPGHTFRHRDARSDWSARFDRGFATAGLASRCVNAEVDDGPDRVPGLDHVWTVFDFSLPWRTPRVAGVSPAPCGERGPQPSRWVWDRAPSVQRAVADRVEIKLGAHPQCAGALADLEALLAASDAVGDPEVMGEEEEKRRAVSRATAQLYEVFADAGAAGQAAVLRKRGPHRRQEPLPSRVAAKAVRAIGGALHAAAVLAVDGEGARGQLVTAARRAASTYNVCVRTLAGDARGVTAPPSLPPLAEEAAAPGALEGWIALVKRARTWVLARRRQWADRRRRARRRRLMEEDTEALESGTGLSRLLSRALGRDDEGGDGAASIKAVWLTDEEGARYRTEDPGAVRGAVRDHFYEWYARSSRAARPFSEEDDLAWSAFFPPATAWAREALKGVMAPVAEAELAAVASTLRSAAAPGPRGLPNALVKVLLLPIRGVKEQPCVRTARRVLLALVNGVLVAHRFPRGMLHALLVAIPKVVPWNSLLDDTRPLTLFDCILKLVDTLVNTRTLDAAASGNILDTSNYGFQRGRNTDSNFMIWRAVFDDAAMHGKELHATLLDSRRAFDLTERPALAEAERALGLPLSFTRLYESLGDGVSIRVVTEHGLSEAFHSELGAPQGLPTAATRFIVLMHFLLAALREESAQHPGTAYRLGGPRVQGALAEGEPVPPDVSHGAYADDLGVFACCRPGAARLLRVCSLFARLTGQKYGVRKTFYVVRGVPPAQRSDPPPLVGGEPVPVGNIVSGKKLLRVLGADVSADLDAGAAFEVLYEEARDLIRMAQRCTGQTDAWAVYVMGSAVMARAAYRLKPWTGLSQARWARLDVLLRRLVRQVAALPRNTPCGVYALDLVYGLGTIRDRVLDDHIDMVLGALNGPETDVAACVTRYRLWDIEHRVGVGINPLAAPSRALGARACRGGWLEGLGQELEERGWSIVGGGQLKFASASRADALGVVLPPDVVAQHGWRLEGMDGLQRRPRILASLWTPSEPGTRVRPFFGEEGSVLRPGSNASRVVGPVYTAIVSFVGSGPRSAEPRSFNAQALAAIDSANSDLAEELAALRRRAACVGSLAGAEEAGGEPIRVAVAQCTTDADPPVTVAFAGRWGADGREVHVAPAGRVSPTKSLVLAARLAVEGTHAQCGLVVLTSSAQLCKRWRRMTSRLGAGGATLRAKLTAADAVAWGELEGVLARRAAAGAPPVQVRFVPWGEGGSDEEALRWALGRATHLAEAGNLHRGPMRKLPGGTVMFALAARAPPEAGGLRIVEGNYRDALKRAAQLTHLRTWSNGSLGEFLRLEGVDWEATLKGLKVRRWGATVSSTRWRTARLGWLTGNMPTWAMMHRRSPALFPDGRCPRCNLEEESVSHVLSCQEAQPALRAAEAAIDRLVAADSMGWAMPWPPSVALPCLRLSAVSQARGAQLDAELAHPPPETPAQARWAAPAARAACAELDRIGPRWLLRGVVPGALGDALVLGSRYGSAAGKAKQKLVAAVVDLATAAVRRDVWRGRCKVAADLRARLAAARGGSEEEEEDEEVVEEAEEVEEEGGADGEDLAELQQQAREEAEDGPASARESRAAAAGRRCKRCRQRHGGPCTAQRCGACGEWHPGAACEEGATLRAWVHAMLSRVDRGEQVPDPYAQMLPRRG